jgi:hypothetical protein
VSFETSSTYSFRTRSMVALAGITIMSAFTVILVRKIIR